MFTVLIASPALQTLQRIHAGDLNEERNMQRLTSPHQQKLMFNHQSQQQTKQIQTKSTAEVASTQLDCSGQHMSSREGLCFPDELLENLPDELDSYEVSEIALIF